MAGKHGTTISHDQSKRKMRANEIEAESSTGAFKKARVEKSVANVIQERLQKRRCLLPLVPSRDRVGCYIKRNILSAVFGRPKDLGSRGWRFFLFHILDGTH